MSSDSITVAGSRVDTLEGAYAWLVCLSAGLFFFYEFFQLNIFDVINESLRGSFQVSASQLSWMSSTYLWADILFLLPAGVILDRFSTRKVIAVTMLVCIIGTAGFAIANSFLLACFFHFLAGIGNAFCFIACAVLVSHWFPASRQALVIGILVTMAFLGGMMAHTPFAWLNEHYGWRNALLLDGLVGLVFWIWMMCIIRDRPAGAVAAPLSQRGNYFKGLVKVLLNPQNLYAGLYASLLNLPIMVLCALWGASYLKTVHQFSDISASNTVSFIYLGSMIGCPLVGFLSDYYNRRKALILWGAVTSLLAILPLLLNIGFDDLGLSVLFFALGLFTSTQVLAYPFVSDHNPKEYTGTALGIASVIIMGGGGLGQLLFGWLLEQHAGLVMQQYHVSDFRYAMWLFPVAAGAALIAALLLRETHVSNKSYS